jgi:hypothetical protein
VISPLLSDVDPLWNHQFDKFKMAYLIELI